MTMDLQTLKNKLLDKALDLAPFYSWNNKLLYECSKQLNISNDISNIIFPNKIQSFTDEFFLRMNYSIQKVASNATAIHIQVYELLLEHFTSLLPYKQALPNIVRATMMPWYLHKSSNYVWNIVDTIWRRIEHKSDSFDYYTRRFTLAGVYVKTLMYYLYDDSNDISQTADFLKKQLSFIGKISKLKNRFYKNKN